MPPKRALHDFVERLRADAARIALLDRRAQRRNVLAISIDQRLDVRTRTVETTGTYPGIDVGAEIVGQRNIDVTHAKKVMRNAWRVNPTVALRAE